MDLTIKGRETLGLSPLGSSIPSPHAAFLPSHTIPNLTSREDSAKHLGGEWMDYVRS